jgi:hypothetical protein
MNQKPEAPTTPPPALIGSLRTGFDAVATHIGLILFPVFLDIFLWMGPHFSIKTLLQPIIQSMGSMPGLDTPDMADLLTATRQMWQTIADQLNLAAATRTFPIGIPSLMSGVFPLRTPFGNPLVVSVTSGGLALGWWLVFVAFGLVAGGIYFSLVAKATYPQVTSEIPVNVTWQVSQSILLAVLWVLLFLMAIIPSVFVVTLLAMFSMTLAQIALMVISVLLIWALVPLLFSPHGIFIYKQNAVNSIFTSTRVVRYVLPGTGLFWLTVLVISQGLDMLWQVPTADSWFTLVGIAGHAFITTSLLAASFVYYHDAVQWVRITLQRAIPQSEKLSKI